MCTIAAQSAHQNIHKDDQCLQKSAYEVLNRICIPAGLFSCCKDGAEVCLPLAVATSCCARETESSLALAAISSSGSCSGCTYTPPLGCAQNAVQLSSRLRPGCCNSAHQALCSGSHQAKKLKLERLCRAHYLGRQVRTYVLEGAHGVKCLHMQILTNSRSNATHQLHTG